MTLLPNPSHISTYRSMSCNNLTKIFPTRSKTLQNKNHHILQKNNQIYLINPRSNHQNFIISNPNSQNSLLNNIKIVQAIRETNNIQNINYSNVIKINNNINNQLKKLKSNQLLKSNQPIDSYQTKNKLKKSQSTKIVTKKSYKNFTIKSKLHPSTIKRIIYNPQNQPYKNNQFIKNYQTAPQTLITKSQKYQQQQPLQLIKQNIFLNSISPIQSKYSPLISIEQTSGYSLLQNIPQKISQKKQQKYFQQYKISINKIINQQLQIIQHQPQIKIKKIINKKIPSDFFGKS